MKTVIATFAGILSLAAFFTPSAQAQYKLQQNVPVFVKEQISEYDYKQLLDFLSRSSTFRDNLSTVMKKNAITNPAAFRDRVFYCSAPLNLRAAYDSGNFGGLFVDGVEGHLYFRSLATIIRLKEGLLSKETEISQALANLAKGHNARATYGMEDHTDYITAQLQVEEPHICLQKFANFVVRSTSLAHELGHFAASQPGQHKMKDILSYPDPLTYLRDLQHEPGGETDAYIAETSVAMQLGLPVEPLEHELSRYFAPNGQFLGIREIVTNILAGSFRHKDIIAHLKGEADAKSSEAGALEQVVASRKKEYPQLLKLNPNPQMRQVITRYFDASVSRLQTRAKKLRNQVSKLEALQKTYAAEK